LSFINALGLFDMSTIGPPLNERRRETAGGGLNKQASLDILFGGGGGGEETRSLQSRYEGMGHWHEIFSPFFQ
jgi:hypothetical protein